MVYSTDSRRLNDSMCIKYVKKKKNVFFFTFLPIILQSIIFPTRSHSCSLHFYSLFCVSLCNRFVLSVIQFATPIPTRILQLLSTPGQEWIGFGRRSEYLFLLSSFSPSWLIICSQLIVLLCIFLSVVIVMMCAAHQPGT